jgi:hypothetical protein
MESIGLFQKEVCTAVLTEAGIGPLGGPGFFLTVAHRFDAVGVSPQNAKGLANSLAATLAQGQVVFRSAPFVCISLDPQASLRVGLEKASGLLEKSLVLGPYGHAVEFKKDTGLSRGRVTSQFEFLRREACNARIDGL